MDVIIIGGGAAGLFAALLSRNKKMNVTLLEKNEVFGKKLSVTGSGRCNYTNLNIDKDCYYSDDLSKTMSIIEEFGPSDTIESFKAIGIEPYFNDSYVYPMMRSAGEFTDVVISALNASKVKCKTNQNIVSVTYDESTSKFAVNTDSYSYSCDKVLVCTGGLAMPKSGSTGLGYKIAESFGHKIIPASPALSGFYFSDMCLKSLSGLRIYAAVYTDDGLFDKGEIQFTQNSISGIPVMNISGNIEGNTNLYLDLLPDLTDTETLYLLERRKETLADFPIRNFFDGMFAKNLGRLLLNNIDKNKNIEGLTDDELRLLTGMLKKFPVPVKDKKGYDEAQVTRGGVSLKEVTDSLESVYRKGLFFAGEVLNTDGRCGGYNLQWAFASAYKAIKGIIV
ncbi:MAG: aminoacetone oxidase family FAD-binding enzyme [Lachnospiraceae bacterium]|nr:aminoacetone oxidase family FAD-binding enzyme [Lachnospiraceae bacterium]